jgi:cyanophycin synthetase
MYYPENRRFLRNFKLKETPVLMVTGTKGKTSISSMSSHVLKQSFEHILLLNTAGVYWNQNKLFTDQDSINNFGKAITVMPGRYFYGLLRDQALDLSKACAIVEASLGCGVYGTGLQYHDIGILTNIYQDHIDGEIIRSKQDLYQLKSFIFREIKPGGLFVTNLDQKLCLRAIKEAQALKKDLKIKGITSLGKSKAQRLYKKYQLSDAFFVEQDTLYSVKLGAIYDLNQFAYYFKQISTRFIPGNLMLIFASLSEMLPVEKIGQRLNSFRFPFEYGRLQFYKGQDKNLVIDFAHEIESLTQVVQLVKDKYQTKPALITRVAPDRSDEFIKKFGVDLSHLNLSALFIFDIIDGKQRKLYRERSGKVRQPGETAELLATAAEQERPRFPIYQLIDEKQALDQALKQYPVVLHIRKNLNKVKAIIEAHQLKQIL